MWCLRYEDSTYEDLRQRLPKNKTRVGTSEGPGIVVDSKILVQLVLVKLDALDGEFGREIAVPVEELMDPNDCPAIGSVATKAKQGDPMRGMNQRAVREKLAAERSTKLAKQDHYHEKATDTNSNQNQNPNASAAPSQAPIGADAGSADGTTPTKKKRRKRKRRTGADANGTDTNPAAERGVSTRSSGDASSDADDGDDGDDGNDSGEKDAPNNATSNNAASGAAGASDAPRRKKRRGRRRGGRGGESGGPSSGPSSPPPTSM